MNYKELKSDLKINCEKCFGLCCSALYFSKAEGFPVDKAAGEKCLHLEEDYRCKIHSELSKKGFKGCTSYDCFGAGQKTAQAIYKGKKPNDTSEMYDVFIIMRDIHEMLWYLSEAERMQKDKSRKQEIINLIEETVKVTESSADVILKFDVQSHKMKVNKVLFETSEHIRKRIKRNGKNSIRNKRSIGGRLDFMGKNLTKFDVRGENFSGALLMASNLKNIDFYGVDLLGADLRDADLCGADLSNSIYLTQFQIDGAKGDKNTILPPYLEKPSHWR